MQGGGGRNPDTFQASYALSQMTQEKSIKKMKAKGWDDVSDAPMPSRKKAIKRKLQV